jgi:hypothetical protein
LYSTVAVLRRPYNIIENEIWLPLSQKNKQMSSQFGNRALGNTFNNLGNLARSITRNCQMNNFTAAVQSCDQLSKQISSVGNYIDVASITEAIQNARVYVNDMATRSRQPQAQPQQQRQQARQPQQQQRQQPIPVAA